MTAVMTRKPKTLCDEKAPPHKNTAALGMPLMTWVALPLTL